MSSQFMIRLQEICKRSNYSVRNKSKRIIGEQTTKRRESITSDTFSRPINNYHCLLTYNDSNYRNNKFHSSWPFSDASRLLFSNHGQKVPTNVNSLFFNPHINLRSTRRLSHDSCKLTSVDSNGTQSVEDKIDNYPYFQDLNGIHPLTKKALVDELGLKTMTEIQYKTFHAAVQGMDILGRSRTGTGKTLAFLLPSLERILRESSQNQYHDSEGNVNQNRDVSSIQILIISPTRELTIQIGQQVRSLILAHNRLHKKNILNDNQNNFNKNVTYQVMYGGSSRKTDIKMLHQHLPTILISTPGRLQDHLSNTFVNDRSFADIIQQQIKVLVLDETDRLLDMGFKKDIDQILSHLPDKDNRQTLLFSATMPKQLRQIMAKSMRSDFVTINCIRDQDPATQTNSQVQQSYVILPTSQRLVSGPVEFLMRLMEQEPQHKIIAFFPTAHLVSFYSNLFNLGFGFDVIELHSRKSQQYRTKMSNLFRSITKGVLFTTDVSARGVDYPDVTHVIQFGICDSRETYIHRLGRTGRAGKKGQGVLVLSEEEENFLEKLKGLNIPRNEEFQKWVEADRPESSRAISKLKKILKSVSDGGNHRLRESAEKAYRSMVGFYSNNFFKIGVKCKKTIIRKVNAFAFQSGLDSLPPIHHHLVKSMGLHGIPGLNVSKDGQLAQNPAKKRNFMNKTDHNVWDLRGERNSRRIRDGKTKFHVTNSNVSNAWKRNTMKDKRRIRAFVSKQS